MSPDPTSIPIYRGNDFYIPSFEVVLGDRKQSGGVVRDIMQVVYRDDVEAIDSFELTVNNWDADSRKFKYSDQDTFEPSKTVELRMGYLGSGGSGLSTMIRGTITDLRPAFPSSGQPTLVVGGQNVLNKFRAEQKSANYDGLTYTQIAQRVCDRLRQQFPLNFVGPQTPIAESVQTNIIQNNEYDIMFLTRLARLAGYDLVADEADPLTGVTNIHFGPPTAGTKPTYKLQYGRSLIEFQPTLAFANQVSTVQVRGWDPLKGQAINVTAGQDQLGPDGLAGKIKAGSPNPVEDRTEIVNNAPVRDSQAAQEIAVAHLRRINNVTVTATGSVVGLPDLRSGRQIAIEGLGLRFNGTYFITKTTHTLGTSGYSTQFECRLQQLSNTSSGEAL